MLKIFGAGLDTSAATVVNDGNNQLLNVGDTVKFSVVPQREEGGATENAFNFKVLGTTPANTKIELLLNAIDQGGSTIRVPVDVASLGNVSDGSALDFSYGFVAGDRLKSGENELLVDSIVITPDPDDGTRGGTFDTPTSTNVAVPNNTVDMFVDAADTTNLFWNVTNQNFLVDTQPPTVDSITRPTGDTDPLTIKFSESLTAQRGELLPSIIWWPSLT